jgi:hypothetical protein
MNPSIPDDIIAAAMRYAVDDLQLYSRVPRVIKALSREDMKNLRRIYNYIVDNDYAKALSAFLYSGDDVDDETRMTRRKVELLLQLFTELGKRGVSPFDDEELEVAPPKPQFNWGLLPEQLNYLAGPAEAYGEMRFDEEIDRYLERMSEDEKKQLLELKKRIDSDGAIVNRFWDEYNMKKYPESEYTYFLWLFLCRVRDAYGQDE